MREHGDDEGGRRRPRPRPRWGGRRAIVLALALGLLVVAYLQLSDFGGVGDFVSPLDRRIGDSMFRQPTPEERYRELGADDQRLLRRQRDLVDDLARRHVGTELTGRSLDDLRVVQEILDRKVIAPDETFALQALGVALGDVMAAQLGLHWMVVHDELGRSRALRLDTSETLVFPVTMISKRVESGLEVDVGQLFEKTARTVGRADAIPQRNGA